MFYFAPLHFFPFTLSLPLPYIPPVTSSLLSFSSYFPLSLYSPPHLCLSLDSSLITLFSLSHSLSLTFWLLSLLTLSITHCSFLDHCPLFNPSFFSPPTPFSFFLLLSRPLTLLAISVSSSPLSFPTSSSVTPYSSLSLTLSCLSPYPQID